VSRILRAVVVAALLLVIFELGVRAIEPALPQITTWREPMVAHKVARMDELSRDGRTDVVFAGTSQMLFAGDPTMFRRQLRAPWSMYNAAMWGAPPVVNEHWLTEVVAPRLRPRTVLLGVSPIDFVEAESQDAVDKYFASTSVRDDWLASVDRSLSRASALVRERRLLRDPRTIADSIGRRVSGESGPKLLAGQVDAFGRASRQDRSVFRDTPLAQRMVAGLVRKGWAPSQRQVRAFRRTVAKLRTTGAEVILADMAVSRPLIEKLGAQAYAAFGAFLQREATALGVPLIDTATGLTSTTFFFDYDHVNRAGADVFNTAVWRAFAKGSPGALSDAIPPALRGKPLVTALASDVIARAEARAIAKGPTSSTAPVRPAV
jgi:hypothetical protein